MSIPHLFSERPFWAKRFGVAPFLPMTREEMENLGWDSCDIIIVTGDAYVDHPSFGMAIIGRLLERHGFRVGIISQPDWQSALSFQVLGKPNLFFGVTSGNMDSMVNHYTADRKIRSDDAYTPNGIPHKRPNRATIVYANRCREAYPDVPVVLGGIEASLRRIAHYDYWSDEVRRSILLDAKADMIIYGNAERAVVDLAHRLAKRESIANITDLRGTVIAKKYDEIENHRDAKSCVSECDINLVRLPSYEEVKGNHILYAEASRLLHLETNPLNARIVVQKHKDRDIWLNPPPIPLTTKEIDGVYDLPFSRVPHPSYAGTKIPAYEMIRFSVSIMRGCFGGCTFCSITAHEGRIIQSRSKESILREVKEIRDKVPGFTGVISDLGGPTANMYRLQCQNEKAKMHCRRFSCIYPVICQNMSVNHKHLIALYREARNISGIKKILIGSGVRYDLAIKSEEYVKELVEHHVGGYLKIAPEHIADRTLALMMKPGIHIYQHFKKMFDKFSLLAKKEQYLIPYFIAAHPGSTDEDMLELAIWLKKNNFRLEQVQNFLPTPMTLATTMYYTGRNPLQDINSESEKIFVPRSGKNRRLQKAFLRYHDPHNWPLLRQALLRMEREDLIGNGKNCLVPEYIILREKNRNFVAKKSREATKKATK